MTEDSSLFEQNDRRMEENAGHQRGLPDTVRKVLLLHSRSALKLGTKYWLPKLEKLIR